MWLGVGAIVSAACTGPGTFQPTEPITIPSFDTMGIGPAEVTETVEGLLVRVDDDLGALVASSPLGTTFVLETGIHRTEGLRPRDGNHFVGLRDSILSGARVLDSFDLVEGVWQTIVEITPSEPRGRCRNDALGCRYAEQLFIDGQRLERVEDGVDPAPDQWSFDRGIGTITIGTDPTNRLVELSTARNAFFGSANDVRISGLIIEKFASPAQSGAIQPEGGSGWVIEDNEIRLNHGSGIRLGRQMQVRSNFVHSNGQFGIAGGGSDVLIEENEISHNNTAGFNPLWAAGGTKFVMTENLVVRRNHVHHNDGFGLWTDIDNIDSVIAGNLVTDNSYGGIKHEISFAATITDNLVVRNGFGHPVARRGAGIMVRESSDVSVSANQVLENAGGIIGIQEDREPGLRGPYRLERLSVTDNLVDLGTGPSGVFENINDPTVFTEWGIEFRGNVYVRPSGRPFLWSGQTLSLEQWQRTGNDP